MIHFTRGNLFDSEAEALVNTVNTVGVMGKGVALQFKEAFPANFREYAEACKRGEVRVGNMFVTERLALTGPRWIVNFPTKKHWRHPSKIEWVREGLADLRKVVIEHEIRSVAIPPLGCGNGGLDWPVVRSQIVEALGELEGVEVFVFEPSKAYRGTTKRRGVLELTPARGLIAELIRRYWILGTACSLLEIQKLAWLLEREIRLRDHPDRLDLRYVPHRYGPYSDRLRHLLDKLDGSYLRSEKRIADAKPSDVIGFRDEQADRLSAYLQSGALSYLDTLEAVSERIDGFESPLGLEAMATVGWVYDESGGTLDLEGVKAGIRNWPGGEGSAERKMKIFDDRLLGLVYERIAS